MGEFPVIEFNSQAELDRCLEWWKEKLYLTDWCIVASIIPISEFDLSDSSGEASFVYEKKEAIIHLASKSDCKDSPFRFCHEKILVHELLHLLYGFVPYSDSYEGRYLELAEHARLEAMAKTLLMVKYRIPPDWFMVVTRES